MACCILGYSPVVKDHHGDFIRHYRQCIIICSETIEVYDDGLEISEPVPAEYHVVRETYTKQGPGEIDLQAGEEVEIIKKNDTGKSSSLFHIFQTSCKTI